MKLVVLMYVLLAFFMVRYANKLWAFKAMSRLQDIQMQIMLFGLWVVVMLYSQQLSAWPGLFCFAAAAVYKFWIDIRLWRRAKSGLRYPCLLLQKGDGIVRGMMVTHVSNIPVIAVQMLCHYPQEGEYYWCRVVRYSFWSARVEVELLEKMDWREKEKFLVSRKLRNLGLA